MKLHSLVEVNRLNMLRAKSGTGRTGGEGNIGKLMMSELYRRFREVGNMVIGADGMLDGSEIGDSGWIHEATIFSPAPSIYGGTDQVQRNIIGERVLGLPKEPGPAKETPFIDLPKN
jgi:alkylation response protein AidB-like acyl-CoA dehydrogenase